MLEKKLKRIQYLIDLEKYNEAKKEVEKFLKNEPMYLPIRTSELIVSQHVDTEKDQLAKINILLEDFPECDFGYYMMSRLLAQKGNIKEALIMAEKALDIDSFDVDNLTQLGIVYYELKDYKNAEKVVRLALEKDPDNFNANLYISLINNELRRKGLVEYEGKNLLDIDYNEGSILYEAEKFMQSREFDKAVAILRQGVVDYPVDEDIRENFILYKSLAAPFIRHFFIFTRTFYMSDDKNISGGKKFFIEVAMVLLFVFMPILYIYTLVLKFYYKKQLKNGKI